MKVFLTKDERQLCKHRNMLSVSTSNDIAPKLRLSYRHLRILAWAFLALSIVGSFLSAGSGVVSLFGGGEDLFGNWPTILKSFKSLMSPLFLIAAFGVVLRSKERFRDVLIFFGALSILMVVTFYFFYFHIFLGFFKSVQFSEGFDIIRQGIESDGTIFMVNIFIDLFLCTLLAFFVHYRPKHYFKGKKLIYFRFMALIPILYEIICITFRVLDSVEVLHVPFYLYPFFTTKPPLSFVIFIVMVFYLKLKERYFIKNGKTHAEFNDFARTNVNSIQYARRLSFVIFLAAIIDFILLMICTAILASKNVDAGFEVSLATEMAGSKVQSWGLGGTFAMIFVIPFVLFYDYHKTHKDTKGDLLVPVVGLSVCAFLCFEGVYLVIRELFTHLAAD